MTDPTAPSEELPPEPNAEPTPEIEVTEAQPEPEKEQAAEITPEERIKKLEKALERKQRAIDRRTAELHAERRQREQNGGTPQPKDNQPTQAPGKLNPNDFETIEDYVDAVAEQKAKAASKAERESYERQQREETEAKTAYQQQIEFQAKIETAREEFSDFDKVTQDYADEYAAPHIQKLIMEADDAGKALYLIAKNDVLAELNQLTTYKASLKIDELIKQATAKPVTRAPAPMSSVKGRGAVGNRTVLDMKSGDEIGEWLKNITK
jgi:hypothetical protein